MEYIRYRFKTKSADDPRPLKDLKKIGMPYWVSGYTGDMSAAIIICYLPKDVDLKEYWDDAFEMDAQECSEITYTDRFPKPDCQIFGSVDSPEISENSKGVPGCRYTSKFLEAARRGEQLAHERYLAESNPARKVLCTFINKNSRALTPVLISQYKSLHELLRASLRGHVDTQGGLFRAVEIYTEKVPESVERWLRGVDAPKPEGAFDIMEQVEYTLVHPHGDSGTTYVYEKS